jgi:putative ABC transport system permease protein
LNNLLHRRLRSWLTILGVVIGIAAIIALVSIIQGFQKVFLETLSVFGSDTIYITPGRSSATEIVPGAGSLGPAATISGRLTKNDISIIKSLPGVSFIDGIISGTVDVKYRGQIAMASIQGVDAEIWKQIQDIPLQSGRYLIRTDTDSIVIGDSIANRLFKYDLNLNSIAEINGQNFKVVGIFKRAGSQLGVQDNIIVMPKGSARDIFTDIHDDEFSSIIIKLSESTNAEEVSDNIEKRLLASHHVTKDDMDFTIISSEIVRGQIETILQVETLLFGGIAGIALFVGGIGIANTMFMSVMERTRQIGVLKSIGATNGDVMKLFLGESALMGLVGGVIGILLGVAISFALSLISFTAPAGGFAGETINIPISITPPLLIFALAFSIVVGSVSGILPARRASKLQPVEALRYE